MPMSFGTSSPAGTEGGLGHDDDMAPVPIILFGFAMIATGYIWVLVTGGFALGSIILVVTGCGALVTALIVAVAARLVGRGRGMRR